MQAPPSAQALKAGKLVIPLSPRTILTGLYLAAGRKVGTLSELCLGLSCVGYPITIGFSLVPLSVRRMTYGGPFGSGLTTLNP